MSEKAALDASGLTVNYDTTTVLWDCTFQVPQGLLTGIIGPNGAGKSTLIRSALGLVAPVSGRIEVLGRGIEGVRKRIAYVPQKESVDWDFPITVRELVIMGRYGKLGLFRSPRRADYQACDHMLELTGMTSYADRQISQLSGGQQQRAFFARALMQEPDVLFLDEPFSGIDHGTELLLMDLLKKLRNEGKSIFIVHHDLNTIEKYFDWVILLNLRLIDCGPLPAVFTSENLERTYGKSYTLFDEALKLSESKATGLPSGEA